MSLYDRMAAYHAESRPAFVLFTEFIAFLGSMVAIVGIGFLRDWLL